MKKERKTYQASLKILWFCYGIPFIEEDETKIWILNEHRLVSLYQTDRGDLGLTGGVNSDTCLPPRNSILVKMTKKYWILLKSNTNTQKYWKYSKVHHDHHAYQCTNTFWVPPLMLGQVQQLISRHVFIAGPWQFLRMSQKLVCFSYIVLFKQCT